MSSAGWYDVDGDNDQVRYWDGNAWTDRYRSATAYYAKKHAQSAAKIASDVRVIKGWVTFMGVLVLIGLLGSIVFGTIAGASLSR